MLLKEYAIAKPIHIEVMDAGGGELGGTRSVSEHLFGPRTVS